MIDVVDRQIWIFREPRSGSTGLTKSLARLLSKEFLFVESKEELVYDTIVMNNTHNFDLLYQVKAEHNPILLRCTRKNRLEQFLSARTLALTRTHMDLFNIQDDTKAEDLDKFNKFIKENTETVSEIDVFKFAERKKNEGLVWKQVSSKFDNHTFYYEDLTDPIDIPILGLYNIDINLNNHTRKLPDYKKDFYTNYDEVKRWMDRYDI